MRRFLSMAMVLGAAVPAHADGCLDRVRELAAAHGVATEPPTAPAPGSRRSTTPDVLSRSGGVVEPPPVSDRSVITPPRDHSGMPTLPDVKPVVPPPAGDLGAADRSTLQALLVAARAQAERGDEAGCLDGLRKVQDLLSRRKP